MFHPVGSQPPSVYWRRRFIATAAVVLLIVLLAVTLKVATNSSGGTPAGGGTNSARPPATSTPTRPRTSAPRSSSPATHGSSPAPTSSKPGAGSSASTRSAVPVACTPSALAVAAVAAKSSYKVGDEPMVEMQVTNTGALACVENLSDTEIVLKIFNGASRVWGSHDCKIEPGTNDQTLAVNQPVRVSITWTGLASQPGECNNRQRVGAGTYTLYAYLGDKVGKATQFSFS